MSTLIESPTAGTIGTNLQPKRFDIILYQGDTFKFDLVLEDDSETPINVTGWTGRAQIKKVIDSSPGQTPTLTLDVGGVDGTITVSLTDTETSALLNNTEYKYDIEMTDTGDNVRTFIGGVITVTEDITE